MTRRAPIDPQHGLDETRIGLEDAGIFRTPQPVDRFVEAESLHDPHGGNPRLVGGDPQSMAESTERSERFGDPLSQDRALETGIAVRMIEDHTSSRMHVRSQSRFVLASEDPMEQPIRTSPDAPQDQRPRRDLTADLSRRDDAGGMDPINGVDERAVEIEKHVRSEFGWHSSDRGRTRPGSQGVSETTLDRSEAIDRSPESWSPDGRHERSARNRG